MSIYLHYKDTSAIGKILRNSVSNSCLERAE